MTDDKNTELIANINCKFTELKCDIIKDIQCKADNFMHNLESIVKTTAQERPVSNGNAVTRPTRDSTIQFKHRESYLTEMLETKPLSTVRNLIWSVVIFLNIHIYLSDSNDLEKTYNTFELMFWLCRGLLVTLATIWLPLLLATLFIVHGGFTLWVYARHLIGSVLANLIFLVGYLGYMGAFIVLPFTNYEQLSIVSRVLITMEQIRMLMKTYAFVRENVPKVINAQAKDEDDNDGDEKTADKKRTRRVYVPKLSNYIYFMFAPTMIYRDEYPRTSHIRWKNVGKFVVDFISTIGLMYYVADRIAAPFLKNVNIKKLNQSYAFNVIIYGCLPAALYFFLIFYGLYQCWQNIWAELLRFGDRKFYADWWTATSSAQYFRTWNILVQNWIYSYLYRDFNKMFRRNKFLTVLFTFILIGVAHDYILSVSFGYIVPVFTLLYTFTVFTMVMPSSNLAICNVLLWISIFITFSGVLCYCGIEWYARNGPQCPRQIDTFYDYLVPRFYYCID